MSEMPPPPPLPEEPNSNPENPNTGDPVYEMLWRCNFCGTDKLRGKSQRFCPNCGAPQEPKNRYFPTEEDLVEVKNAEYQGVDKTCAACGTPNAANSSFCSQCGSAMDGTKTVNLKVDTESPVNAPEPPAKKRPLWVTILVFIMLTGLTFCGVNYFWRETVTLELATAEWQKEIKVEKFQTNKDSAWCDVMPRDAYAVSRKSEVRSQKQIPDGETCKSERVDRGDGTFTTKQHCEPKYRNEPVYGDKCYFSINRWKYERSLLAKGMDKQPREPALDLARTGNCLGCEREAAHVTKYVLTLNSTAKDAKPIICEVPEAIWKQAEPKSKWQMEMSVMSDATHCDTLLLVK